MRRATLARPSTRSATAVGATLVMLGAGLLVPSLAASADESHSDGDHRVVVCHHVEGHDGVYLRSVVDVNGIHGHARHEDDIIGEEGETDLVCPGPTVSEMPEQGEHGEHGEDGEESTHTATPKPSHTSRPKPSHTSTPKPSHSHSESCSHSATPTPTETETETETGTPTPTEPTTPAPTVTPTQTPSETPVETDTATPVDPGTDEPATTDPVTTDPATTDPVQPGLAQTGSNPLLPMGAGILLVLVGIGAMVLGRPRGTHA